jgi:uncharacterized protein (TIGR02594 family)
MPRMIQEAVKLFGTIETPGSGNNPVIMAWAKEVGVDVARIYTADSIPWCGLAMAVFAKRADKEVVKNPLWALSWATFGHDAECAMLGDVLTFVRKTATGSKAGHVALYVGESATTYHILGGNQSDKVCIIEIAKSRLYAIRRPDYNIQPNSVAQVVLNASGVVSTNEA